MQSARPASSSIEQFAISREVDRRAAIVTPGRGVELTRLHVSSADGLTGRGHAAALTEVPSCIFEQLLD